MSNVATVGQSSQWKGVTCHQTPDDLFNLAECIWVLEPACVIEVGPGEGGTTAFLDTVMHDRQTLVGSVDLGDPVPRISGDTLVILDGDVYSEQAMARDLENYGPIARWLVVCHTMRPDWGSVRAVAAWLPNHHEWARLDVPHPTQHTWLVRR